MDCCVFRSVAPAECDALCGRPENRPSAAARRLHAAGRRRRVRRAARRDREARAGSGPEVTGLTSVPPRCVRAERLRARSPHGSPRVLSKKREISDNLIHHVAAQKASHFPTPARVAPTVSVSRVLHSPPRPCRGCEPNARTRHTPMPAAPSCSRRQPPHAPSPLCSHSHAHHRTYTTQHRTAPVP